MTGNPFIRDALSRYRQVWALNHSMAVLGWDMETHMPKEGARSRGIAAGQLAMMAQKSTVELNGLVEKAENSKSLDDLEKGDVRVLRRNLDFFLKVPPELVDEIQRVTTEATVVWRSARAKSNFKLFRPHLEKIVQLERKVADKLGYERHPYNALLNQYEEGFTVRDADAVFSQLIPATRKILAKVASAGVYPSKHPLESVKYETAAMERVNEGILKILRMPKGSFRMDVSTHPFTVGIAPEDVRITTRYEGSNFKSTLFSTIHESGHALYDLGVDRKLAYTPLGDGASLGMHESQSRFWENVVGRSRDFVGILSPLLRKNLPFLSAYDDEQLYYYFNTVRKSFIRVDADEVTYNLHIALRYEIEKKLIAGEVGVSELPSVWDETFEDFFSMKPRSDADGVLQDVHWSGGSLGYFPTYSLGNVVLGMIWHKMNDGRFVKDSLGRGDVGALRSWLKTNIHRYGATYAPKELQKMIFGETYNPEWLIRYLNHKFVA